MVRELAACFIAVPAAGCSLILDFSDRAIPADAAIDAPYSAQECAYKEPNDSFAAAAAVTPADTGPAAICAGAAEDRDFYRFTVPAEATRVEIRIASVYSPAGDVDLRLHASASAPPLSQSHNFANEERIVCPGTAPECPALTAGDYVFEVLPGVPGAVNRYTFALAITP